MAPEPSAQSPYIWDRPVAGEAVFVGRTVLLRTLQTGLAQGRSFAVLGGPRTGRTSLLQQIAHLARKQLARPQLGAKIVPVVIDLSACQPGRPQSLAAHVWTTVRDAVLDPFVQTHPNPPRPGTADPNRSPDPWPVVWQLLAELWDGMANTPGWCRTLWLFDNADHLGPGAWKDADAVLATVASGGAGNESWRPLGLALAGGAKWQAAQGRPNSPWVGLRAQALGALRDAEVSTLLRAGGGDAQALAPLVQASGKHPQVLQCLLGAYDAAEGDMGRVLEIAQPALQATFAAVLATFPPVRDKRGEITPPHALMELLITEGGDVPLAHAESTLRLGPLKPACDLLEQAAVVERVVRGNSTLLRAPCALWNSYYQAAR